MVVGPESLDDAGVIDLGNGQLLVQTVDFFPPIVDEPRDFGRIAAANALSDIYAMGATPFCVLNIVGFPKKELGMEVLGDILEGAAEKIAEAGAALLGGHSVEDSEIKYGLSVSGLVTRELLLTNGGASPGDRLVLTKPLGMGAVSTSISAGKANEAHVEAATRSMATLNAGAARAMNKVGCRSVTDITGFGLLGHAAEMARASDATLQFQWEALPFTAGARDLAARKVLSGGAARTRRYLGDHAHTGSEVPGEVADLVHDSETSGGLLIAVPPEKLETLLAALEEEQTPCAVEVGEVQARQDDLWVRVD